MISGHCYYLELSRMSYDDAKSNCASKFSNDGMLFEPITWDVNKLVWEAYKDKLVSGGYAPWIGVNDIGSEPNFKYTSSGASIPFNPQWFPGYSNEDGLDCVFIWTKNDNEKWRVHRCSAQQTSICQKTIKIGLVYSNSIFFIIENTPDCADIYRVSML